MLALPEMHLHYMQSIFKSCSLIMYVMSCQNTAYHLQKGRREGGLMPRHVMQVLCMHGAAAAVGQCAVPYLPERRPDVHPAGVLCVAC